MGKSHYKKARIKFVAFSLCFLVFFLLFDVYPEAMLRSRDQSILYDEETNTAYILDQAAYNEWNRRKHAAARLALKDEDIMGRDYNSNEIRRKRRRETVSQESAGEL